MDMEALIPSDAAGILGNLESINAWLGGVRATLWHFKRFSLRWTPGEHIRIIDWGTGGADMPRALVRWGRANGYVLDVTGVDRNPEVLTYAKACCASYPEIRLVNEDLNGMTSSEESFDYAISSLCLHHLTNAEIVELLKKSDRFATRGLVMNDLKRSARAWAWIWALSRIGGAHPIVQNDGPLSVKRAFTAEELRGLVEAAGLPYPKVYTHFGYRLTLAGEKS